MTHILPTEEARRKGLFEGKDESFIQDYANVRAGLQGSNEPVDTTWPERSKNRKSICDACEHLDEGKCLEIKKKSGCSSCSKPWAVYHAKCPRDKWSTPDAEPHGGLLSG